eukprot:gene199-263_t
MGVSTLYHILALIAVKNMLVLGGYQMYFWPQNNHKVAKKKYLNPTNLAILCVTSYNSIALHAWLMLMHSSFWFVHFPTGIHKEFREQVRSVPTDRVTRFIMDLVHATDTEDNACPSMHCAFAVFLAFITYPFYPVLSVVFPLVVSISCLCTKQHLIIDIIPGFALGALHGFLYIHFL